MTTVITIEPRTPTLLEKKRNIRLSFASGENVAACPTPEM
jgi:hypothetical protein